MSLSISSTVLQWYSNNSLLNIIIARLFALDNETFNLLKSKKKSEPLGIFSGFEDT